MGLFGKKEESSKYGNEEDEEMESEIEIHFENDSFTIDYDEMTYDNLKNAMANEVTAFETKGMVINTKKIVYIQKG